MSWKYRANDRKPDTSTGIVLFIVFPAIIGLFFVPKVTLFIGFILIIFWILDKKLDKQNKPTLSNFEERLERVRVQNKNFDPNYKGSESYQALLKKYDGNIPVLVRAIIQEKKLEKGVEDLLKEFLKKLVSLTGIIFKY